MVQPDVACAVERPLSHWRMASLVDPVSTLGPLRQFAVQWIFQVRPELAGCVIVI